MKKIATDIEGLYIIENFSAKDDRGLFVKDLHSDDFISMGLDPEFKEEYYSISHKDVIRGMHFQAPPHHHNKLVSVVQGAIIDVVVDIREKSKTKGQVLSFELSQDTPISLYISKGLAHGFRALVDNTIVTYKVSTVYAAANDCGIKYDSIPFDWGVESLIMSNRDKEFPTLAGVLDKKYFNE